MEIKRNEKRSLIEGSMTRHYIGGLEHRPFSTATKNMTRDDRLKWFNHGVRHQHRKREKHLSYILRKALRQEWGLPA